MNQDPSTEPGAGAPTDCERFADEKLLFAHGELGRAPAFDAHLAACAVCRADAEEMREVRRRYRETSAEAMPEPLRARLMALRPRAARPPAWQRWVTVAAAALLLTVLLVPLLRRGEAPPQSKKDAPAPASDMTFRFDSVDAVRATVLKEKPKRPPVRELHFDRELRELKRKLQTPRDDEW